MPFIKKKYIFKGENKMLKENSKLVYDYLKANAGKDDIIANDIADATGLTVRQVNGIVTSALQKKGFAIRTPGEIELEDGSHKAVKFISLTKDGMNEDLVNADPVKAE